MDFERFEDFARLLREYEERYPDGYAGPEINLGMGANYKVLKGARGRRLVWVYPPDKIDYVEVYYEDELGNRELAFPFPEP